MLRFTGLVFLVLLIQRVSAQDEILMNEHVKEILAFYLPISSSDPVCNKDANLYLESVMSRVKWAQTMFDSSAQLPNPSLTMGNGYDLGNFDTCLELILDDSLGFVPKYSLTDVFFNLTQDSVYFDLVGTKRQRWAFCIPSSCSDEDLSAHVQTSLSTLLGTSGDATVNVKEGNSRILDDPRTVLDGGTITAIVVLSCLAGLVVVASIVDILDIRAGRKRSEASKGKMVILAFSGYTNGMNILNITRVKGSIDCVNGIRWFCIMWVMMGHRWGKEHDMPSINHTKVLDNLMYYWPEMILMNAYLAVETFFLLGGMLLSYIFMKSLDATKKFDVITFYIYRYIRLTPPLALLIWIYSSILIHTGWGPLWYEQVGEKASNCQQRWWVNLLYVNNYVWPRSDEACVPQTWYLAVDMQLFILSPALMYPLWRWPKIGYLLSAVLIFFGVFTPWYITMVNDFPWQSDWSESSEDKMTYFIMMYNVVWTRFTPYVVGILLGYFLNKVKNKKIVIKPIVVAIAWVVFFGVMLSIIFTLSLNYTKEYNQWEAGAYNSLHRLGWALAVSWMIFACHHGYGGPINTFLSWVYFQPLARLSYCAYLTHIMVQLADLGTARTESYYSQFRTVHKLPGDFLFILLASMVLNLCSETPILILEKTFLKKAPRPKPPAVKEEQVENGETKITKI